MSQVTITVTSVYRRARTTLRAKSLKAESGREYLAISRRAFRAAEDRCAYAGTDGIDIGAMAVPAGYYAWQQCDDGSLRAWIREAATPRHVFGSDADTGF